MLAAISEPTQSPWSPLIWPQSCKHRTFEADLLAQEAFGYTVPAIDSPDLVRYTKKWDMKSLL